MNIDKLDWLILDALADDYESMNQIYPIEECPQMSREGIVDRVYDLYQKGFICLIDKDKKFIIEEIKVEPEGYLDTKFWFGMTEAGAAVWEGGSEKHGGYKQDWSKSWSQHTDCQKREGVIYATSKEICLERLKATPGADVKDAKISSVPEFRAKYYKVIKGGFKLEFKINEASKQRDKWRKSLGLNRIVIFSPLIVSLVVFVLYCLSVLLFYKVRFLAMSMLWANSFTIFWFIAMLWIALAQGILGVGILFRNQKVGALHLYSAISVAALYYVIMWSVSVKGFIITN